MSTLLVGRSNTDCRACNRGASPDQITHDTIYEYSPDTGKPGCGVKFTHIYSTYVYWTVDGVDAGEQWCRTKRPDLIYGIDTAPAV